MKQLAVFVFLMIITFSCATARDAEVPLKDRTLFICKDRAGLCYTYRVCRGIFGHKCEWKTEFYDLSLQETRSKLIHMGFRARSVRRFRN